MSKQKSYQITDIADGLLEEMAERNGLGKSAALEVLIRQSHAVQWSVAIALPTSATPLLPDANASSLTLLKDIDMTNRLRNILIYSTSLSAPSFFGGVEPFTAGAKRNWSATVQDLANVGLLALLKCRNVGKVTIAEAERVCAQHGCRLVSSS